MGIKEFSSVIQSHVYKEWLNLIDKNIIRDNVDSLRKPAQRAERTQFLLTPSTLEGIYASITGKKMPAGRAEHIIHEIELTEQHATQDGQAANVLTVKVPKANGTSYETGVLYKSIGFDVITSNLNKILNEFPEIDLAYHQAETEYIEAETARLKASPEYNDKKLSARQKQILIDEVQAKGAMRGKLGYYYSKGHVISIASNEAEKFKKQIEQNNVLTDNQKNLLADVLQKFIDKLKADDLASANLPDSISQEFYASYIKDADVYLVEMQPRLVNERSGSASAPVVNELRKLFSGKNTETELAALLKNSPTFGTALVLTKSSPSFMELKLANLVRAYEGKPKINTKITSPSIKIGERKIKVKKPKKNTDLIGKLGALKADIVKSKAKKISIAQQIAISENLTGLQALINASLFEQIRRNMGTGERKDVLNYRTGRFAHSAKVERMSQSRAGAISAFYTYMKNPYATFSEGGKQQSPRTRDPKLLISKSIREIASAKVANRLRAVVI